MFLLRIWRTSVMTPHQAQLCSCVRMNQLWLPFSWVSMTGLPGFNGDFMGNYPCFDGDDGWSTSDKPANTGVSQDFWTNPCVQCLGFNDWSPLVLDLRPGRAYEDILEMYKQHILRIVAKQQWIVCGSNLSQKYESPAFIYQFQTDEDFWMFVSVFEAISNRIDFCFLSHRPVPAWPTSFQTPMTRVQMRVISNDVLTMCCPRPSYKLI